jgi:penicillin-binding protein 1A
MITEADLETKGYRVYTTLDPTQQRQAYDAVRAVVPDPADPEAALAAVDDRGFLRAMVGGRDFSTLQVNLATATSDPNSGRSPGSSFKPIVLAQYLSEGGSLDKLYSNPPSLPVHGEADIPSVESDATPLPIDLRYAMAISSNTVYAQLQMDTGYRDTVNLAVKLGLPENRFADRSYASPRLALGDTVGVSALEMAGVYSTFANRGEKIGPFPVSKVTTASGQVVWEAAPDRTRVLKEDVADQINWTLRSVLEDPKGTGYKNARVPGQVVAGKTGTTDKSKDAWFVGYTCKVTAAVWMGYVTPKPMEGVHGVPEVFGGTLPAQIFQKFMSQATAGKTSCPFERPLSSIPATSAPPATLPPAMPSTTSSSTTAMTSTTDPNGTTSTTRRFPFPFPTLVPPTTEPGSTTTSTTTSKPGPTRSTTTTSTTLPGPFG